MTPTEAALTIHALSLDVALIRARGLRALDHIERCRGGYPATASGANRDHTGTPDPDADPVPDPADIAYRSFQRELSDVARDLAHLAKLIDIWTPADNIPGRFTNAEQLAVDDMWCVNHRRHGRFEPRAARRGQLCRWCADVQRDAKHLPDRELIERRAGNRRLTTADYDAFRSRRKNTRRKQGTRSA